MFLEGNKSGSICFTAIFDVKLVCDDKAVKLDQNVEIEINKINELTSERDVD